jgi:hypothetical protein
MADANAHNTLYQRLARGIRARFDLLPGDYGTIEWLLGEFMIEVSFISKRIASVVGSILSKNALRHAGIVLGLLLLCGFCLPAWTQETPAPSPPTASKVNAGPEQTAVASPDRNSCPPRPIAGVDNALNVVVALDPDTLWRPRGGEVHFTISSRNGGTVAVAEVQVCMGWSFPFGERTASGVSHDLSPSPLVRSVSAGGSAAVFGAMVPNLTSVPSLWPFHLLAGGDLTYTAADTVPVADMVVAVTLGDGTKALVLLPVGVTSVIYAVVLVAICVVGFFVIAWAFVRRAPVRGHNVMLKLICTQDGFASLSQFQILLWTVTIGASAVYVMVLSGNLINLTDGTLVLLGIAGGAALLARVPGGQLQSAAQNAPTEAAVPAAVPAVAPAAVPAVNREARWSDLVIVDRTIDITRVQMLIFTLISAAFVILKVLVGYAIPDIPVNFQMLMGISNGIYVVGRQLPNQSK